MQPAKRRRLLGVVLSGLLVASVAAGFLVREWASFPGRIAATAYTPLTQGIRSTYGDGVVYRHAGAVPLLEVSGTHYEMGVQYGVLLRPEILASLQDYGDVVHAVAEEHGLPAPLLLAGLRFQTWRMAGRLPQRFREEIRGVSRGSGVPERAIIAASLLYDVSMAMGCTGLLMRGADGAVIHGRSQEPFGIGYGGLLAKHTVIVRHRPDGYHTVTHVTTPLFLGVETGYNERGLAYSAETYSVREPDRQGFPIVYLARRALEEASSLEDVRRVVEGVSVAAPGGAIWSDRKSGRGMRIELTPAGQAVQELAADLLWDFNDIVDPELARQQHPRSNLADFNRDRERIAAAFPRKPAYAAEDAIGFLRSRHTADGSDHAWLGTRGSIANAWGQQVVVFDPQGDGLYLAVGETYAALREVAHYRDDFSQPPEAFAAAVPLEPIVEEAARIGTGLMGRADRLRAYVELSRTHTHDANAHFLAAYEAFRQSRWEVFADHAVRAHTLRPDVPEYRLYAGLAAYRAGDLVRAIEHLEGIGAAAASDPAGTGLSPEQELYRLMALERAWATSDPRRSAQYEAEREALLERYGAGSYYQSHVRPRLEALEPRSGKPGLLHRGRGGR